MDDRVEIELNLDQETINQLNSMALERNCSVDDVVEMLLRMVIENEKFSPGSSVVEPESLKFCEDGFDPHPGHQNT